MLDVTRLRVLVAVARCGSVTAAARALNYAQPSVSHHLARLEAETGTKLIQRAGRGIRLTDAGRLLAERAAEVIGRLDAAENELAAYTGLRAGRLRLAAFPSALGTIVPAAGAMLREHQPGVDLRLTEAEPPEALRMLRAGYVDVALVFRYSPDPDGMAAGRDGESTDDESGIDLTEGLREKLLLDEPVHLVTSASAHPGPGGAEPPAELTGYARHRWIAGCDRCRANLLRQCALAGFTPKIAFTTDDYVAVQALVAADLGVSTLPALCLRAARHPGIRTVPLPGARRYVFAVRYGDPPDPPAVKLLMEVLRTAAVPPPRAGRSSEADSGAAQLTVASVNPGPAAPPVSPPAAVRREPGRLPVPGDLEPIPGQLALPGMPSAAEAAGHRDFWAGQPTLPGLELPAPDRGRRGRRRPGTGRRGRGAARARRGRLADGRRHPRRAGHAARRPAHRPLPLGPAAQDREDARRDAGGDRAGPHRCGWPTAPRWTTRSRAPTWTASSRTASAAG